MQSGLLNRGKRIIMNDADKTTEISELVQIVTNDLKGDKTIDDADFYSKPDKLEVHSVVDALFGIVYPGYYKDRNIKIYNREHSIAVAVENIFYHLNKLVVKSLEYSRSKANITDDARTAKSFRICSNFFRAIPDVRRLIESDLKATFDGDPAAGSLEEVILAYPGLVATTVYRLAHELYVLDVPIIPRLMSEYAHTKTGIDIHPGARIGEGFFIDHGTGIVIGETAVIGRHVKIYQGVTIGSMSTKGGQKLSGFKRHPTIGDNVTIYAGASILGGDTLIGNNTVIGGNTFITSSVPANTKVRVKNPEMEYLSADHKWQVEEVKPGYEWFYVI